MGSTFTLKAKTGLKPLHIFFYHERTNFLTQKTSFWKSAQLLSFARCLCIRDTKSILNGKQTNKRKSEYTEGQSAIKNSRQGGRADICKDDGDKNGKRSTLWQKSYLPKSVFAAGTAKRMAELLKTKVSPDYYEKEPQEMKGKGKMEPPDRPLSLDEWRTLKESFGRPQRFDVQMMSSMFTSESELDVAKSLLTFVAVETGTLSYELLLRYLTLCVRGGHNEEVFDIYDIMRESFPSLDTGASTLFIKSFSRTDRWKEGMNLLHEIKKVFTPSPRNYGDVISAAMLHGDTTTAWALYDELLEKGLSPHPETWCVLFTRAEKTEENWATHEAEHHKRLLEILLYMRNNQIYPNKAVANAIKTWFESLSSQNWTGSWTSIRSKGLCGCCGSELESIQLTAEEYQELKDKVITDVIQGQDVFKKTTPEELEHFKEFVRRKPAFDVVVDGLNVANVNRDKSKLSHTLLAVVSELKRQGLTILVLGRKHMLRPSVSWDRKNMSLIQQKAHCFFTDNISEDDPFLLYATLHSGSHCRFVSRDLMRDHKACLPDGATRRLFFKWQRGHQLVVEGFVAPGKRVQFQSIPSYDTIVQTTSDSWHIPYDDTEDRSTYEVPQRWLCLTKKP